MCRSVALLFIVSWLGMSCEFAREANPLAGRWAQERRETGSGNEVARDSIGELVFETDGTFSVTWHPFETYKDYWGTYVSDPKTGRIGLTVKGGNYVPADFDGEGTFALDGAGFLTLQGICLGRKKAEAKDSGCGLVFRRYAKE